MSKSLANLPLVVGILSGAFVLHLGYALLRIFNLDVTANQILTSSISKNSNYLLNGFLSLTNTISVWLGFAEPIRLSSGAYNNEVTSNLVYALTHKTLVNVPYPFTPSSLYNGFANFGGVGVTLALVIGILWIGRHKNQQTVAVWSALPAIFNTGLPIMFGAQVFLNPFFVLPFVFLPVLNMVIASGFIFLHIIPPIVYPVPNGTPGILVPFIGTGGDWRALVLSIALLLLDIAVYLPFIKWAFEPHQANGGKEASQNEND
jgi:PTS system cellobiose-specific IIC component